MRIMGRGMVGPVLALGALPAAPPVPGTQWPRAEGGGRVPIFGVCTVVTQGGRVLLVQREDSGAWCLPGGAIEPGETLAQAAVREAREETGQEVRLNRLVGVYSRPRWQQGGSHDVVFAGEAAGGALVTATPESVDARFFPPDALPADLLWWERRPNRGRPRRRHRTGLRTGRGLALRPGRDPAGRLRHARPRRAEPAGPPRAVLPAAVGRGGGGRGRGPGAAGAGAGPPVTAPAGGRPKPLLVVVSGAPAAGKTTLARRLAPELGLVRLCKDEVRETLGDWIPPRSHPESRALGGAAYALCFSLAAEALASGVGVVLEAAFSRGQAEPALRPLVAQARAVLIHLAASSRLSSDRFRARHARGERHPAHLDEVTVATPGNLWEQGWSRWEQPLDLDVPTLVIDTSGGYEDDLAAVLGFIRAA